MLTLTVPNAPDAQSLPIALAVLIKGFERLRRRAVWPAGARGVWNLEITYSEERGFHPHLHIVGHFPWFDLAAVSAAWRDITGAEAQPDIRRPSSAARRAGLIEEGLKYPFKVKGAPRAIVETIAAILGKRKTYNNFGTWPADAEGKRPRFKMDPEEPNDTRCPCCGDPYRHWEWDSDTYTKEEVREFMTAGSGMTWPKVYFGFSHGERDGP